VVAAIAEINGKAAMAYNAENGVPWHKLGQPLDGQKTGEEMLVAANLDWQVIKQPILTYAAGSDQQIVQANVGKVVTMRDIDSHPIGVVGATYQPIQNSEMFDFADALLSENGGVVFETAGALNDGRVVFALASIPEKAVTIDGDPQGKVMPYIILSTGHDGLRAFTAAPTPVRVVCQNTLNMAMSGASNIYRIKHTVNALDRVAAARKAFGVTFNHLDTFVKVSGQLMKLELSINDVWAATEKLIPALTDEPEKAYKAVAQRESIVALYQNSANLDGVPFTAYRFVQAVAEYADHAKVYRGTKVGSAEDARALGILTGNSLKLKADALRLVLPSAVAKANRKKAIPIGAA
jgi:phage/plasmid-like protein (TIGR03299 family)